MALVIDDSSTVWALHKDSLVTVERYVYFPSSRRSLGLSSSYFEMRRCGWRGSASMWMSGSAMLDAWC